MPSSLLRNHWPAAVLAFSVGTILVWPSVLAKVRYGIPLSYPSNIRVDDETFYFGRIRDVLDGYPTIGNAYLWEHKSKPPSPVFLGEYLAAQPIRLLGMGPVAGGVLYDALLPPVLVLLTYACLWMITRKRWASLLGTAVLVFGVSFTDLRRVVSPQLNFLFWLSQFLFLHYLFGRDNPPIRRRLVVGLATLNFGLLFYLYTYYWTFYLAFLGILAIIFLFLKRRKETRDIMVVVLGGLALAIPYFFLIARAIKLPEYAETLRRIGMIDSHFPSGILIVIPAIALLAAITLLSWQRLIAFGPSAAFFISGLLAAMVSVNQHVITGKNLEFSSHYFLLSVAWFVFTAAWLLVSLWPALPGRRIVAAGLLVVAGFVTVRAIDIRVFWLPALGRIGLNRYVPLFSWLNDHTGKDEVIFAPDAPSALIPIYTDDNVFFSNLARLSFVPDAELIDRFILAHYFDSIDYAFVVDSSRSIFGVGYIDEALHTTQENKVRRILGLAPRSVEHIPENLVKRVLERSDELHHVGFEPGLKKYRVDYIIWDMARNPGYPYTRMSFLEPIGEVEAFRIYRVH